MQDTLNQVFWGNTLLSYILTAGGLLITRIIWKLTRKKLIRLLKSITGKTKTGFDDLLVDAADKFAGPYLYLAVNYAIIRQLVLAEGIIKVLSVAAMLVTLFFVVRTVNFIISNLVILGMRARHESEQRIQQVQGMLLVVKTLIWAAGLIMFIDNLGYNVTTIIAGLGVGGIAIALAAQSILADLFSYIVIFFDKPFEIGDFIITGNNSGVVEKIGIKTSHIRSLDGQQLVMPNTDLVKSVIQNYKRLEKRRVVFTIGVTYDTKTDTLRNIPAMIKDIIDRDTDAAFDRANFLRFGDFSILYEIVYYIASPDYVLYTTTHERICLNIFERFGSDGIEFAFPTQTIYLDKAAGANNIKAGLI
jgi:small-conductance mechanosensitive channel